MTLYEPRAYAPWVGGPVLAPCERRTHVLMCGWEGGSVKRSLPYHSWHEMVIDLHISARLKSLLTICAHWVPQLKYCKPTFWDGTRPQYCQITLSSLEFVNSRQAIFVLCIIRPEKWCALLSALELRAHASCLATVPDTHNLISKPHFRVLRHWSLRD